MDRKEDESMNVAVEHVPNNSQGLWPVGEHEPEKRLSDVQI